MLEHFLVKKNCETFLIYIYISFWYIKQAIYFRSDYDSSKQLFNEIEPV